MILLELDSSVLDLGSGVWTLACFRSSFAEEILLFPFKSFVDCELGVGRELGLEEE